MAVNPDPKPGRWILPLVILGMVAFTYFFVRELPAASPDTTLAGGTTTTTVSSGSTTTSIGTGDEVSAYLDEIDRINGELQLLKTELVTSNSQFDSDEIDFETTQTRFRAVETGTQALETDFDALTPPSGLEVNHDAMKADLAFCSAAATDAISGLVSTDPGDQRRSAVDAYATSAEEFNTEVTNARNQAGG
jgi:hypothetical protein